MGLTNITNESADYIACREELRLASARHGRAAPAAGGVLRSPCRGEGARVREITGRWPADAPGGAARLRENPEFSLRWGHGDDRRATRARSARAQRHASP
jgi:hypothetical protein